MDVNNAVRPAPGAVRGPVGGSIVHHDDVHPVRRILLGRQGRKTGVDVVGFVPRGDDDGDGSRHLVAACVEPMQTDQEGEDQE